MPKITRIKFESYYLPITITIGVILIVTLSLYYYFTSTGDGNKISELLVGAVMVMVLFFVSLEGEKGKVTQQSKFISLHLKQEILPSLF